PSGRFARDATRCRGASTGPRVMPGGWQPAAATRLQREAGHRRRRHPSLHHGSVGACKGRTRCRNAPARYRTSGLWIRAAQGLWHAGARVRLAHAGTLRCSSDELRALRAARAFSSRAPSSESRVPAVSFVHLRIHTEYSLADSIIRVEAPKRKGSSGGNSQALTDRAAELQLPALAVTDL